MTGTACHEALEDAPEDDRARIAALEAQVAALEAIRAAAHSYIASGGGYVAWEALRRLVAPAAPRAPE